jgi:hypothetical protein
VHGLAPPIRTSRHNSAHFVNCPRGGSAKWPRFPDLSRGGGNLFRGKRHKHIEQRYFGGLKVLSHRATTGFGGLIAVAAILLAAQIVSGVAAFPL